MKKIKLISLILIVIITLFLLYQFVIPRVEVETTTFFHESPSGINVNVKVRNSGNREIQELNVTLKVFNSSEVLMAEKNYAKKSFDVGEEYEISTFFQGDHYEPYTIHLKVAFERDGEEYSDTFKYTAEDYMNINWKEKLGN